MPEDVAFISSKSGVDTSRDGKVMSAARKIADRQTDRQTDGFSSLYSRYIVDCINSSVGSATAS